MISQLQDSEDDIKDNGSIVLDKTTNALPKITGFEHEWDTLLTTSEDLKNFEAKGSDEIYNYLKNIGVNVYFNGGRQKEIIPIRSNRQKNEC